MNESSTCIQSPFCEMCYHCEKGVAPFVTTEMWKEAGDNKPAEWFAGQNSDKCEKCYACQKCYSGQESGKTSHANDVTYFVFLTNECNLRCTYCYATKTPRTMTPEILLQLKHFIAEDENLRLGNNRDIAIQFFGGEPTMEWERLRRFVVGFTDLNDRIYHRKIRWGMTTNCTLLTETRLRFMKDYGIKPLLSIDGRPETHDIHRKTVGGGGSSCLIDLDLILKYFPNPEIRPTITPESVGGWYDDLMWFHSKGCFFIATEVAYEAAWDNASLAQAQALYEKLGDLYVELKAKKQPAWMKFIEDCGHTVGSERQTGPVCGIAKTSVAIDAEGLLYACQRYASFSRRELNIGNIFDGFDAKKLAETQTLKREDMFPDPTSGFNCEDCVARWTCRGGCNAMNFQTCGDRRMIMRNHCIFHRMWAEIALKSLARTGELFNRKRVCNHQKGEK